MKNRIISIVAVLLIILVGTYIYFSGKEYIVRISESQIKAAMDEKLPLTKTYLFIIDVTLQHPRVELVDGSGRIAGGMDVELNVRVNENTEPLGGSIDISGGVSYMADEGKFFLTDPVVENFSVQGLAETIKPKVNKAIEKALSEYFSKNPIYTLKKTDLKQAAAYAVLKNVSVEGKDLVVVLGI